MDCFTAEFADDAGRPWGRLLRTLLFEYWRAYECLESVVEGNCFHSAACERNRNVVPRQVWSGEERCRDGVSAECTGHGGCCRCAGDRESGKVQGWNFQNYRRHGGVPECVYLGQARGGQQRCAIRQDHGYTELPEKF